MTLSPDFSFHLRFNRISSKESRQAGVPRHVHSSPQTSKATRARPQGSCRSHPPLALFHPSIPAAWFPMFHGAVSDSSARAGSAVFVTDGHIRKRLQPADSFCSHLLPNP
jgi:hypothetical protein